MLFLRLNTVKCNKIKLNETMAQMVVKGRIWVQFQFVSDQQKKIYNIIYTTHNMLLFSYYE